MLEALADGGGNDAIQMVDSASIRAHHCAAGARGTQNQALGRSRGGLPPFGDPGEMLIERVG